MKMNKIEKTVKGYEKKVENSLFLKFVKSIELYLNRKYKLKLEEDFYLLDLSWSIDDSVHYILMLKGYTIFLRNKKFANSGVLLSGDKGKNHLSKFDDIVYCCENYMIEFEKDIIEIFPTLDSIISQNKYKFGLN